MTRFLCNLTLAAVASATAGGLLFGQSEEPAKPDHRASAYYHATLGHMYSELAAAYGGRGEYLSKAIENYKLAMREDPATAYLPQELADLYLQSGQARVAIAEFEDALKKNPDDLNARRILARFYTARISQGQQQRMNEDMLRAAIEQYQKISEQAPKDLENWLMLGRLQKLATNSAAAEKAYKKALELDPDGEEALTGLAMVYGDLGDNTNATLLLKRVAEKSPSLRTLTALAIACDQMKDYKGSAEAYRRALELNRENTDLKTAYAEELLKTGDDNSLFMEYALPYALVPDRKMGMMANNAILNERMTWAVGMSSPGRGQYESTPVDRFKYHSPGSSSIITGISTLRRSWTRRATRVLQP